MPDTSTESTTQPNQPSDADVQVRIAGLADACARQISDIVTDVKDTMLELAERFHEVRESTDPVDFWQLILEHVDDEKRQVTMELFGDDIAEIIALPLDVLKTHMANFSALAERLRDGTADGYKNFGQFNMPNAIALRAPLQPKTHRDRMRALVATLLAESPKVEDATADDIGAIQCIVILRGGYQQRGVLKPSDDGETLRFMTVGKVATERGEKIHAMEMVFDYDDLTAIVTEKAVAETKPGGIFG
jgi:hypothetical protein